MEGIYQLNVGGRLYATTSSVLQNCPNSFLDLVVKERLPVMRDAHGAPFIDRNSDVFQYILDFLRNGNLTLPRDFSNVQLLRNEAHFYLLPQLITEIDIATAGLGSTVLISGAREHISISGEHQFSLTDNSTKWRCSCGQAFGARGIAVYVDLIKIVSHITQHHGYVVEAHTISTWMDAAGCIAHDPRYVCTKKYLY